MAMLLKRDGITCPGRGAGWNQYVFGDPLVMEQYKAFACRNNQWAITSKKDAKQNWHGVVKTYVDQQDGRHSSKRPGGRQYNLLAFGTYMAPSISDRPDQTGLTERAQQANDNAGVMNKVLTKIEQGSEFLQPEEYEIRFTQEPKRAFPMSDVFETKLDSTFQAKNEDLPEVTCERTNQQGSHFDPRHTREERPVNTDVMSRLSHWSTAIRNMLVALEHILQTNSYSNSQRRRKPSNRSQDLFMVKRMIDESIRTREILGTRAYKASAILEKLVPLAQVLPEIAQVLHKHFQDFDGNAAD